MGEMRKITAFLPTRLVDSAMKNSGAGVTETLRQALADYNHRAACQNLLALRGKFPGLAEEMNLAELREDRELDKHGNVIR
jgi:hypothetical protein